MIGTVTLVERPVHTDYMWGPITEIAGQTPQLIKQNPEGACLAMFKDKGLVDVDPRDIKEVRKCRK